MTAWSKYSVPVVASVIMASTTYFWFKPIIIEQLAIDGNLKPGVKIDPEIAESIEARKAALANAQKVEIPKGGPLPKDGKE
ncbi:hypothetical protein B0I72DRAFT_146463 [Yarrowia lipolytica]|uniref:Uncharacterized protein n=1 Tax=Yarrowia lipolytica TaxID=4952 RepID=A0A1H6PQY1_YARLL|nr:hypothetical protein YALI1_F24115g [Yarrowia lipolytica]KAB8286422.1 hypothetical protein BKA91DRAFT_143100 [Yarrowia lipolytica]KAE8174321.1 hypothetical protein BKA90DRAFT_144972 [Yarrowia lipolytica]KAJ8055556.1 hypothetical protein LXG23DRAFT_57097 [Yarrowia lipolytica]QNQ00814.1 Hypothetical protein YALI2_F00359g [Yarrowia lipolytica]